MNLNNQKKRILLALAVISFFLLPVTVLLLGQQQNTASQASTGTTLSFEPTSSEEEPIETSAGEDITIDLVLEPGEGNLISFVKFVIEYDPDNFELVESDAFELNTENFPELLEKVTVKDGTVTGSVSVGSDPTKAVSSPTTIGTLTMTAKKATTDTPTVITYTPESQVLSVGENDDPDTSVLSNTGAAFLTISNDTPSEQSDKTETENPEKLEEEEIPDETVRPRFPTDIPESEPNNGDTILNITALLHGIGSSGDSLNTKNSSQSNKSPQKITRVVAVSIWDSDDLLVDEGYTKLNYDKASGTYQGKFATEQPIPNGTYAITITAEGYLTAVVEESALKEGAENKLANIEFVAGDIYPDEKLDILDYTVLADCGYGTTSQLPMDDPESLYNSEACQQHESRADADLDSNGVIDAKDFNLFLREFAAEKKREAAEEVPSEE